MIFRTYGLSLFVIFLLITIIWQGVAEKLAWTGMKGKLSILEKLSSLDPRELLELKTPRPNIYVQATLELKRLCDRPICHRMAAYLLMNNCKGLNEIDKQNYSFNRGQLQQDQVDAFAATLTICDLERAKFDVPKICLHFTSASLMKAAKSRSDLEFSSKEVNDCLQGLGKNAKHWATWLSYRDSALLFCRAAHESISLHRELTAIMKEFSKELHLDLQQLKNNVAVHKSSIESVFQKINEGAGEWKSKFEKIFSEVSRNINDIHQEVNKISQENVNARVKAKEDFSMILKDSAQISEDHKHNMRQVAIEQSKQHKNLKDSLSSSEVHANIIKNALIVMQEWMLRLQERQDNIDRKTQVFETHLTNTTMLLQGHAQELEKVSSAAQDINQNLERASLTTSLLQSQKSGLSWKLISVLISTLMTLILGNCRLRLNSAACIILIFSGFIAGNLTAIIGHWQWVPFSKWIQNYILDICNLYLEYRNQTSIISPVVQMMVSVLKILPEY
ncbi:hypothetical protein GcM1_213021 [Golovinomyces cichoracearum]|uniref:Nuclear membrane fusion protein kar5 n=1 Tax=Golovinomyces cichoracearum TaxID=62708 RepID=A0A420IUF4_9PEZI|nr:hypothetical protein GcM1_213021 [Golovinomyces cichoracearum]